jgi:hypothetical protein
MLVEGTTVARQAAEASNFAARRERSTSMRTKLTLVAVTTACLFVAAPRHAQAQG